MADFRNIRFKKTLEFIQKHIPGHNNVLDLGTPNLFSKMMEDNGYNVINTGGEDLDLFPDLLRKYEDVEFVTALQIFEHIINPFSVLQNLPSKKLVASIPLSLWFAKAYRNEKNEWDQHFHEFEDWQFNWLLQKAGWKVIASEKWIAPTKITGIGPLLRRFTPRIYIVYAERV